MTETAGDHSLAPSVDSRAAGFQFQPRASSRASDVLILGVIAVAQLAWLALLAYGLLSIA